MFNSRNIIHFLFPGAILFIACCLLVYSDAWLGLQSSHIDFAGLIILAFGLFLGWRFDRNRIIYALSLLLVADIADRWFVTFPTAITLHKVVSILLPFNFFLLALLKEKGVRKWYGAMQLGLLPVQGGIVYIWLYRFNGPLHNVIDLSHFPYPLNHISDAMLAALVMALTAQLIRYFRYQTPLETAFIWAILCVTVADILPPGVEATLFRVFAVLIVIISILEISYTLAYRDDLTSLPSRRALNEAFRKLSGQYVIAMADIDHFKKLNDTYGHDVGDQVLKMVAARLMKCPGGGQAFRYGGEEFCLLFRGKMPETVLPALEKLRTAIADEPFVIRQTLRPVKKPKTPSKKSKPRKAINVTVSIGLAGKSNLLKNYDDVLKAADKALYRAKRGGRNRVEK